MWKVLVTGSRAFTDREMIRQALIEEWRTAPPADIARQHRMIVIQGNAKGADWIAGDIATATRGVGSVIVPADWNNDKKSAGPKRNRDMLALGPDVVLAFYKEGAANIGTSDMVRAAKAAGVPVKEFRS